MICYENLAGAYPVSYTHLAVYKRQYEQAVNEMLVRTSTTYAPWTIIEGNSKYFARVKVLETVVEAMEEKIREVKKLRK